MRNFLATYVFLMLLSNFAFGKEKDERKTPNAIEVTGAALATMSAGDMAVRYSARVRLDALTSNAYSDAIRRPSSAHAYQITTIRDSVINDIAREAHPGDVVSINYHLPPKETAKLAQEIISAAEKQEPNYWAARDMDRARTVLVWTRGGNVPIIQALDLVTQNKTFTVDNTGTDIKAVLKSMQTKGYRLRGVNIMPAHVAKAFAKERTPRIFTRTNKLGLAAGVATMVVGSVLPDGKSSVVENGDDTLDTVNVER